MDHAAAVQIVNQLDIVALLGMALSHDAVCPAEAASIRQTLLWSVFGLFRSDFGGEHSKVGIKYVKHESASGLQMLTHAFEEAQLLADGRQVLDGPERGDRQFESSGETESSHISFDQSDSVARIVREHIGSRPASRQHALRLVEAGDNASGVRGWNEDPPGATTQFERVARLPAEIDIETYVGPLVV